MSFLFGKKQTAQAFAEVLEDGRALAAEETKKPKYRSYQGAEPQLKVAVRVQPENEPAFEAPMTVGLTKTYLLKPGVRVRVKYDPVKKTQVQLDDENPAILERNPQLRKES